MANITFSKGVMTMNKPMHLCETCRTKDICMHRKVFEDFMDCEEMNDIYYADGDKWSIQAGIVVCEYYAQEAPDAEAT